MTVKGKRVLRELTPRERQVVVLVCAGWNNPRIGVRLGTSEQVVKNIMGGIFAKAGTPRNRIELVLFSFKHGLIECPCSAASRMELEQRREKPVDMRAPHSA